MTLLILSDVLSKPEAKGAIHKAAVFKYKHIFLWRDHLQFHTVASTVVREPFCTCVQAVSILLYLVFLHLMLSFLFLCFCLELCEGKAAH